MYSSNYDSPFGTFFKSIYPQTAVSPEIRKMMAEAFEAGRQLGMKQERALWELAASTQEIMK